MSQDTKHWWCESCNTFDGPTSADFCDVCSDGTTIKRLVLAETAVAVVFDGLSWMPPSHAKKWQAESSYKRFADAVRT